MTALSEAQLIEIMARFASLERQIERADWFGIESNKVDACRHDLESLIEQVRQSQ